MQNFHQKPSIFGYFGYVYLNNYNIVILYSLSLQYRMNLKHVAFLYIMCCPFDGAYWGCWLTGGPVGPGGPYGPGIGPVWGGYLFA